jgi:hypothetical protein
MSMKLITFVTLMLLSLHVANLFLGRPLADKLVSEIHKNEKRIDDLIKERLK